MGKPLTAERAVRATRVRESNLNMTIILERKKEKKSGRLEGAKRLKEGAFRGRWTRTRDTGGGLSLPSLSYISFPCRLCFAGMAISASHSSDRSC